MNSQEISVLDDFFEIVDQTNPQLARSFCTHVRVVGNNLHSEGQ